MNILKRFKTCSLKMVIVTLIMSFKYLLVTVCDIEECTPYTDWSEIVRTDLASLRFYGLCQMTSSPSCKKGEIVGLR